MSKTKSKILRAARLLFNEHGVTKVSQRRIADHIAISPGNLTYHFKKREDIIEALYIEMASNVDEVLDILDQENLDLKSFKELTKEINTILFESRFFMIDLFMILRSNKKIQKDYLKLSNKREKVTIKIIDSLVKHKLMRTEELPEEYEFLSKRIQLFGDFWIASIGAKKENVILKDARIYTENLMQSIYPYLTKKGKEMYKKI